MCPPQTDSIESGNATAEEIAARTEEAYKFISNVISEIDKVTFTYDHWTYIYDENHNEIARGQQIGGETTAPYGLYELLKDYSALKAGEDYIVIDQNTTPHTYKLTDDAGNEKDQGNTEKQNALNAFSNDVNNTVLIWARANIYSDVNINGAAYTFKYYSYPKFVDGITRNNERFVVDNNENINGITAFSYSYILDSKTGGKVKIEGNVSYAGEYDISDSQLDRLLNPDAQQDPADPSTPTTPEDTETLVIIGAETEIYPDMKKGVLTLSVENAPSGSSVTWTSSSDAVTIDDDGVISANVPAASANSVLAIEMHDVTFTATAGDRKGSVTIKVGDYSYDSTSSTFYIYNETGLLQWPTSDTRETDNVTIMRSFSLEKRWSWSASNFHEYSGTFDGQNYTISNLNGESLVNRMGEGGVVKNVILEGVNITASEGVIADYLPNGKIENCKVSGNISGNTVGGIVGTVQGANVLISNCTNDCEIFASSYGGGIAGFISTAGGKIEKCISNGIIKSNSGYGLGGIVGFMQGGEVSGCIVTSNFKIEAPNCNLCGEIVGWFAGGTV